jgi:hypothetical protein
LGVAISFFNPLKSGVFVFLGDVIVFLFPRISGVFPRLSIFGDFFLLNVRGDTKVSRGIAGVFTESKSNVVSFKGGVDSVSCKNDVDADLGLLIFEDSGVLPLLGVDSEDESGTTFDSRGDFLFALAVILDLCAAVGVTLDGDWIVCFAFDFLVNALERIGPFRHGVAFRLEGVFLPTLAKTLGVFALTFRLITMVSGDVACLVLMPDLLIVFLCMK